MAQWSRRKYETLTDVEVKVAKAIRDVTMLPVDVSIQEMKKIREDLTQRGILRKETDPSLLRLEWMEWTPSFYFLTDLGRDLLAKVGA